MTVKTRTATLVVLELLLCTLISGCTPKKETARVSIQFSSSNTASSIPTRPSPGAPTDSDIQKSAVPPVQMNGTLTGSNSTPAWNTALNPTAQSDFNCYAVLIGATDLIGNSCELNSNQKIEFGPNVGFIRPDTVATLDVTPGENRTIYVLGLNAISPQACERYSSQPVDFGKFSQPYVLAQQNVALRSGDNSVNIRTQFQSTQSVVDCNVFHQLQSELPLVQGAKLKFTESWSKSTAPLIEWQPSTNDSRVTGYELSIGTAPGLGDIRPWTNAGGPFDSSVLAGNLNLLPGQVLYASMRTVASSGARGPVTLVGSWTVNSELPVTNGVISAAAKWKNKLVIAGTFTKVGRWVGGFAKFDGASGMIQWPIGIGGTPQSRPRVNGRVKAIVFDGAGSYFVGGRFSTVSGVPRKGLAKFQANGSLDSNFDPQIDLGPSGEIWALAIDGSWLYVAGSFLSVDSNSSLKNLVRFNLTTGAVDTSFAPDPNAMVSTIAISGSELYAGGQFTTIGGQSRNRIAAVDTAAGAVTSFNPNASNWVLSIAVSGSNVYAAGQFTNIGGASRNRIAALDSSTGTATTWNPNASGQVNAVAIGGSSVYAGGSFTNIGGQARSYLAAIDISSGNATTWNPSPNFEVKSIAISGSQVYVGGSFNTIAGQARKQVAALSPSPSAATSPPWVPQIECMEDSSAPPVIASGPAGSVLLGCSFEPSEATLVENVAVIDVGLGGVDTSYVLNSTAGAVQALHLKDQILYLGGSFSSLDAGNGPQSRNRVTAYDMISKSLLPFSPPGSNVTSPVQEITSNSTGVYVAQTSSPRVQRFNFDGSKDPAFNAAAVDAPLPSSIGALVHHLDTIYVGIDKAPGLLQIDPASGADLVGGGRPSTQINASSPVPEIHAIVPYLDSVIVAGNFATNFGKSNLLKYSPTSGSDSTFPTDSPNTTVGAIAISESRLFLTGTFTDLGSFPRKGIASIDLTSNGVTPWSPENSLPSVSLAQRLLIDQEAVYVFGSATSGPQLSGGPKGSVPLSVDSGMALPQP